MARSRACRTLAMLLTPLMLAGAPGAAAQAAGLDDPVDQWLPRSDGAAWVYAWSDNQYAPTQRVEKYTVQSRSGRRFRLHWQEVDAPVGETPSEGIVDFTQEDAGLVNTNYQSTQPPPQFPILCASASECGNSLAGSFYMLIWGTRSPTIAEPLLAETRWSSLGGAGNDVASVNRYVGRVRVVVPAFPNGIVAAKIDSEISQAGALGDPYGSGVRTVYWVRGVGPVLITFRHVGGDLSQAALRSTTLTPLPLPSDENLLPLNRGDTMTYRWRNSRHMKRWSKQRFTVTEVVNNSAKVEVKHVSGPIKVAGSYAFTTRLAGVSQISAYTRAATRAKFPKLGPSSAPSDSRRSFFTPFDLMVYGFNPIVPVYGKAGDTWRSSVDSPDWKVYGVAGVTTLGASQKVKTPAGTFNAVAVRSTLQQRGFPFGSGTRTSWFAPDKGLVKLVFHHRDGSTSTVERVPG